MDFQNFQDSLEFEFWCHLLRTTPLELTQMPDHELKNRIHRVQKKYSNPKYKHQRLQELQKSLREFKRRKSNRKLCNDKFSTVSETMGWVRNLLSPDDEDLDEESCPLSNDLDEDLEQESCPLSRSRSCDMSNTRSRTCDLSAEMSPLSGNRSMSRSKSQFYN
uniref:Uncharacterized protein n=1 Tax=Megaselia scalaris TaxID=36166 RepID=T1GGX8_MEGSC